MWEAARSHVDVRSAKGASEPSAIVCRRGSKGRRVPAGRKVRGARWPHPTQDHRRRAVALFVEGAVMVDICTVGMVGLKPPEGHVIEGVIKT